MLGATRQGRASAPHSGRVLVHGSSARQRQLLLRRCGDWTRCGTMRRKEPDALAVWASGVRVPWSADWRADASCEGGTDDIRGEGCDRHEPRPSLDALGAFRGRGAGPLQGVRRGARIPRESFQPILAGAGQETPDGSPELASPRTPGTRRCRHGSRVPSPNRGASCVPFCCPQPPSPRPESVSRPRTFPGTADGAGPSPNLPAGRPLRNSPGALRLPLPWTEWAGVRRSEADCVSPAGGCAPHTPIPDEHAQAVSVDAGIPRRAALAHPPALGFLSCGGAAPTPPAGSAARPQPSRAPRLSLSLQRRGGVGLVELQRPRPDLVD